MQDFEMQWSSAEGGGVWEGVWRGPRRERCPLPEFFVNVVP